MSENRVKRVQKNSIPRTKLEQLLGMRAQNKQTKAGVEARATAGMYGRELRGGNPFMYRASTPTRAQKVHMRRIVDIVLCV
jgi:hypothetical protein